MGKYELKNIVHEALTTKVFEYLIQIQNTQSKIRDVVYTELSLQPYLQSHDISNDMASFIFQSRSRMLDVRTNYRGSYPNGQHFCQACLNKNEPETQQHILKCEALEYGEINSEELKYEELYGQDVFQLQKICKILKDKLIKENKVDE